MIIPDGLLRFSIYVNIIVVALYLFVSSSLILRHNGYEGEVLAGSLLAVFYLVHRLSVQHFYEDQKKRLEEYENEHRN